MTMGVAPTGILFLYGPDRVYEMEQLFLTLQKNQVTHFADIRNTRNRKEAETLYLAARKIIIVPSPGLEADPLLSALLDLALDDLAEQRKIVVPLQFDPYFGEPDSFRYISLKLFIGVKLFSREKDEEQQRQDVYHQLQKLIEFCKE